jgi:flagellar biosynthesis/type III secretory pathway M-ring protein FliF/YscJ
MAALRSILRRLAAAPASFKAIAAIACVVLVGLAGAVLGATRDTRVPLFATALKPDQLADVEARLAGWNVAYAPLADNVRVERARREDLLLRLSLAGVPRPHLSGTDEVLAHVGALTPQSVLEAQTRDALAADLALGLRGLDGVTDARVIIAPARAGEYSDEPAHDASASVRVTLIAGAHLSARAIAGIKAFVAGGVPGLAAEHVTVLDDRGLVLDGDAAAGDGVEAALQSALDAAFGAGATIVRAHRETLGEERDVRDVRRAPLPGTLARSSNDERFAGKEKKYSRSESVEDRGSDTHEEHRLALPGATQRLSVAVFVDASKNLDLTAIRALAEATAGIDRTRGDVVSVEAVRFAGAALPAAHGPNAWILAGALAGSLPQLLALAALAAAAFAGAKPAFALFQSLLERASVRATARDVAGIPPLRVRGALAGEPPHVAAAIISALPAATAAAVLELYPAEERTAIVARLARSASTLVPPPEELIRVRG